MKNGKDLKGLVVEEHEDRILLSTANGEIPILRRGIAKIQYDDPAQNFLKVGRLYEEKERWGEALAYYEKALELNPDLEDAKKAAVRVRNRHWAKAAVGPIKEVEKRQSLYETWDKRRFRSGQSVEKEPQQLLDENLGIRLEKKGDWVQIADVKRGREGSTAGLRRGDRLVSVDGESLRYLDVEAVRAKLISPRYSSFTLEYDRDCKLMKTGFERNFKEFGFEVRLEMHGLVVRAVAASSAASRAGLKENDLVVEVNGGTTRYLSLKKLMAMIQKDRSEIYALLTVRRSALLPRK